MGYAKDIPDVTLTFTSQNVGVELVAALTGYDSTTWPGAGVNVASALGAIDAIVYIKDPAASQYIYAAHARNLQIRDFTYTFAYNGEATEDYTAIGSERRFFTNSVTVETLTAGSTAVTALSGTPIILKNGNYLLTVKVANVYLLPTTSVSPAVGYYYYNSGTKVITINTADKATASDKVIVVYQSTPVGTTWADVADTLEPVSIRGKDITISIAANNIPRVQTARINGTLNVTAVKEMGNRNNVGYQKQVPDITGDLSVLTTDTDLLSILQYGVAGSTTEFTPGEVCPSGTVSLQIKLFDPCQTEQGTLLKSVYLDKIDVTSDNYDVRVGNNQFLTQTFNFRSTTGSCVVSGIFQ